MYRVRDYRRERGNGSGSLWGADNNGTFTAGLDTVSDREKSIEAMDEVRVCIEQLRDTLNNSGSVNSKQQQGRK